MWLTVVLPDKLTIFLTSLTASIVKTTKLHVLLNICVYLNQRCVRLREKNDNNISILQVFFAIKPYLNAKEKVTKGSTVGHLSDKDLKAFYLVNPKSLSKEALDMLTSIVEEMIYSRKEINELQSLRDYLLPLLMNGQVKIND